MKYSLHNTGFTLTEVIVVVGILGMITVVLANFQTDVFRDYSIASAGITSDGEMRSAIRAFMRDARAAAPAQTGAYALETTGTSTFTFYSDVDGDTLRDRVRYFISGATLTRGVTPPTGFPAVYVSSNERLMSTVHNLALGVTPLFIYYDVNYTGTTSPLSMPVDVAQVRYVRITLIVDADSNRPRAPVTLSGGVMIRSLKNSD